MVDKQDLKQKIVDKWSIKPSLAEKLVLQARNKIPMNNIKRIVLTGGPCAGKTTAQVRIVEHFSNLGFKVFTVPEVPTRNQESRDSLIR